MPRALCVCSTIVAAFQLQLAAAAPPATTEEVPITAPVASLAERVGVDVERDRPRFVPEIIRRVYSPPPHRQTPIVLGFGDGAVAGTATIPLASDVWTRSILRRAVPREQVLAAILSDRRAALLCRGLSGLDDETLAFYLAHPALLSWLYERGAPAFGAFGASVRVHDGRIAIPGGDRAGVLWESALLASARSPDAFIRALFAEPGARLAYLFDILDASTPEARAFALGFWMPTDAVRIARFQALASAVRGAYREWNAEELPFARPLSDLSMVLLRLQVDASGQMTPPASRQFWEAALNKHPASGAVSAAQGPPLVDAAWLVQATDGGMYARGDSLDQLAFAQRAFGAATDAESSAVASIVAALPQRRMLLLTLERMGIRTPAVYAAALRQADVSARGGGERFWTLAQLQGALAILARMQRSGTLDAADAEQLATSLLALTPSDGDLRGALAPWIESVLVRSLPPGQTWEVRLAAAVAGRLERSYLVDWEGETYRLDVAFAERRRIAKVRSRQGGADVDEALALARFAAAANEATSRSTSTADLRQFVEAAQEMRASIGTKLSKHSAQLYARGVPSPRDGSEWLTRIADEFDRAVRTDDLRRATRAAESLTALSNVVLGEAILSFVYAMHLGDPEGPALLGANVALRHDFGFARRDGEGRGRMPWAQPRQDFQPGVPWHVTGSLLGLDIALAPLAMWRMSIDSLDAPPQLPSIEREAFAVNVALLDPRRLTDGDRDRVAFAVGRGRTRVRALTDGSDDFVAVTQRLGLDGWRVRALRWVVQNRRSSIEDEFSLAELMILGGPDGDVDSWGAAAMMTWGCVCTRFPVAGLWRVLAGRSQAPMLAAVHVDMNLMLAEQFVDLRLPAALLPAVLATAMQDFVDQAPSADSNDVAALTRQVRTISRQALENYVAAAATLDGPLVATGESTEP